MKLVDLTGLSYGKIYRIFNGGIEKPTPDNLKVLAQALQLDYSYLFQKAGYYESSNKPTDTAHQLLPLLTWDYCLLAFPFQESITAGLSDDHITYPQKIHNGFGLIIDEKHQLSPLYMPGDTIICAPNAPHNHNSHVLYMDIDTRKFRYGILKSQKNQTFISSLHQDTPDDLCLSKSLEPPILGTIIQHRKS